MKKYLLLLTTALAIAFGAKAELFVDAVFVKASCYVPYQIPVPWFYYEEDASLWGEYSVYGVDVGVPWSATKDLYGVGAGVYLDYTGRTAGFTCAIAGLANAVYGVQTGVFSYTERLCGVQVGVVNMCERAYGVQIGLVNIIKTSPVLWLPIVNAQF